MESSGSMRFLYCLPAKMRNSLVFLRPPRARGIAPSGRPGDCALRAPGGLRPSRARGLRPSRARTPFLARARNGGKNTPRGNPLEPHRRWLLRKGGGRVLGLRDLRRRHSQLPVSSRLMATLRAPMLRACCKIRAGFVQWVLSINRSQKFPQLLHPLFKLHKITPGDNACCIILELACGQIHLARIGVNLPRKFPQP